ncbi:MAG: 50S ribosomal protein L44e [Candidatus Micrarchaeota archaeon]|nr:50S ribosomal protein L44e [Candidatus Micrarchaeota archaeon]
MKIENQIMAYCPYCNKHTLHKVSVFAKSAPRGQAWHTLLHNRKITGYVGSVSPKQHPKKLGKRQVLLLQCTVCKKTVQRSLFGRSKKKVEVKR